MLRPHHHSSTVRSVSFNSQRNPRHPVRVGAARCPSLLHLEPSVPLPERDLLIRQVYGVDPPLCARCGGTMEAVAVIDRPAVVRQILDHLGLSTAAASFRTPPSPPREWSCEPLFATSPSPDPLLA